jgi:glutaredoxin 3
MEQWPKVKGEKLRFSPPVARRVTRRWICKRIAGSTHDIEIHDMHQAHIAARAKQNGIRSVPRLIVDGKLAGCCAGRGPDEAILREAIR